MKKILFTVLAVGLVSCGVWLYSMDAAAAKSPVISVREVRNIASLDPESGRLVIQDSQQSNQFSLNFVHIPWGPRTQVIADVPDGQLMWFRETTKRGSYYVDGLELHVHSLDDLLPAKQAP